MCDFRLNCSWRQSGHHHPMTRKNGAPGDPGHRVVESSGHLSWQVGAAAPDVIDRNLIHHSKLPDVTDAPKIACSERQLQIPPGCRVRAPEQKLAHTEQNEKPAAADNQK